MEMTLATLMGVKYYLCFKIDVIVWKLSLSHIGCSILICALK